MAYFAPYIDAAGYHYPTYNDILGFIVENARDIFGQDLYLGADSQDYQLMSIFAKAVFDSHCAAALAYDAHSPATSVGTGLDAIVAVNGIARKQATRSVAAVTLTGAPGTAVENGMVADEEGRLWDLPAYVAIGEDGMAEATVVCRQPGQIAAPAETITRIMTPQMGWTAVTNPEAAIPGSVAETDAQLRARQALSTAQPSASMMEGLEGALHAVADVSRLRIYENDTHTADENGIPPHSVCCVVEGGDAQTIARTIFNRKPIGCGTYGAEEIAASGAGSPVRFQRPSYAQLDVAVTVRPLRGYHEQETAAAIRGSVAAYLDSLDVGEGVAVSMLWWAAMNAAAQQETPAFSVLSVAVCRRGETLAAEDIALGFDEIIRCGANDIEVIAV